jgi:hypothetical protein
MRRENEIFMAMLHDLDPSYASGMVATQPRHFWDGTVALDEVEIIQTCGDLHRQIPQSALHSYSPEVISSNHPRLFSTDDRVIGLMPPFSRPGDILVRFCKTDLAYVFRCCQSINDFILSPNEIVGTASLIGQALIIPEIKQPQLVPYDGLPLPKLDLRVEIEMDLRLLQLLTQ